MKFFVNLIFLIFLFFPFIPVYADNTHACIQIGLIESYFHANQDSEGRFGSEMLQGVNAAQAFMNSKGGKRCYSFVKIETGDSLANISEAISRHIENFGTKIFIGLGTSDKVKAAVNILREKNLLLFSPTATSEEISLLTDRVILLSPTNHPIISKLIEKLSSLNLDKVALVCAENSSYSRDACHVFEEIAVKDHLTIVGKTTVLSGQSEKKIEFPNNFLNAQAIFLPLYEMDTVDILAQLHSAGYQGIYVAMDSWRRNSPIISSASEKMQVKALLPITYDSNLQNVPNQFLKEKHMNESDPTDMMAFSFDALRILDAMTSKCNFDAVLSNPRLCLSQTLPFDSVLGTVTKSDAGALIYDIPVETSGFR